MAFDAYTFGRAQGLESSLNDARQNMAKAQEIINRQGAENNALRAEIASVQAEVAVLKASEQALLAQVKAMIEQHKDSPLLVKTNISYKSKTGMKSKLRLIYEKVFDEVAKGLGISNPASRRVD